MRKQRMAETALKWAQAACVAFTIALMAMFLLFGCGGEEDGCFGPEGTFMGDSTVAMAVNCTVIPDLGDQWLTVSDDQEWRNCGWHTVSERLIDRADGCTVYEQRSILTKNEGYKGVVMAEVSCPGMSRACGLVWETDFKYVEEFNLLR